MRLRMNCYLGQQSIECLLGGSQGCLDRIHIMNDIALDPTVSRRHCGLGCQHTGEVLTQPDLLAEVQLHEPLSCGQLLVSGGVAGLGFAQLCLAQCELALSLAMFSNLSAELA